MTPAEFEAKLGELEIRWRAQRLFVPHLAKEALTNLRIAYVLSPANGTKQLAAALKAGRQPTPAELERATKSAQASKGAAATTKAPGAPAVRTTKKPAPVAAAKVAATTKRPGEARIRCRWVNPTPILA